MIVMIVMIYQVVTGKNKWAPHYHRDVGEELEVCCDDRDDSDDISGCDRQE